MMNIDAKLKNFIAKRPEVVAAFGYGSGVFKQTGYDENSLPQIDMIFVVEDVQAWHQENRKRNREDYSWTGACLLPSPIVHCMSGKTHIIYQSNIEEPDGVYKYGMISRAEFEQAMETWSSFYVPGRLQKPVYEICTNDRIDGLLYQNRRAAIVAAACFLPQETTCFELYMKLCSLSYYGDSRMYVAENPEKVRNIVTGSYDSIHEIYEPIIGDCPFLQLSGEKLMVDHAVLRKEAKELPESLRQYLQKSDAYGHGIAGIQTGIQTFLERMNFSESVGQTAKGLLSNGLLRSVSYVIPKLQKKFGKQNTKK